MTAVAPAQQATAVAAHLRDEHGDCPRNACGLRLITTEDVLEVLQVWESRERQVSGTEWEDPAIYLG
jgi:hypothetical protein